jgi:hypothetical protein
MLIGGGTALAKGDLKSGLMAGLGAYGGAGLMGGAATMGAEQVATEAGREAGLNAGAQSVGVTPEVMATPAGSQAAMSQPIPTGYANMDPNVGMSNPSSSVFDPSKAQQYSKAYSEAYNPAYDASNVKNLDNTQLGLKSMMNDGSGYLKAVGGGAQAAQYGLAAMAPGMEQKPYVPEEEKYDGPLSRINMGKDYKSYDPTPPNPYYQPRMYNYAGGGPVEQMSNANAMGANTGYPMADVNKATYSTPYQTPISQNVVTGAADTGVNPMTGEMNFAMGGVAFAQGGQSNLGSYSDGGRMLKGPGDGMSDSIPAKIGAKQPARLADGEFVVPADVVSHLGNGSTDAGAKQLYSMMDRIRAQRTGKKKQAPQVNPKRAMPA